jgi:endonuclease YncB( thermonuclease family)
MKTYALAMLLAVATLPATAQTNCGDLPKSWEGKAYAVSGNVLAGIGFKPLIRLWGIHAPELDASMSVPAMRARAALEDMLGASEHTVSCRMAAWDSLCRAVAQCTITAEWPNGSKAQPHDLGLRLIEDGFAYGYELGSPPDWDKDASEKIAHFEAISRQAHMGLWPEWLGEKPKN